MSLERALASFGKRLSRGCEGCVCTVVVQEHVNCIPGQEEWQMSMTKNEVGCHSLVTIAFKSTA